MSGWLNKIQSIGEQLGEQIKEVAGEVLAEAREETDDVDAQLQSTRRRCDVAERRAASVERKLDAAVKERDELERQLHEQAENADAAAARFSDILAARDSQLAELKSELDRTQAASQAASGWGADFSSTDADLEEQIAELQKEAAHWKRIASSIPTDSGDLVKQAVDRAEEQWRQKKELELSALIRGHHEQLDEQRDRFETEIHSLKKQLDIAQACAPTSTSQPPAVVHAVVSGAASSASDTSLFDTIVVERDELQREKRELEEQVVAMQMSMRSASNSDAASATPSALVEKDWETEIQPLRAELEQAREQLAEKDKELERQRLCNRELATAYDEVSGEFGSYRAQHQQTIDHNRGMSDEIDRLRASLVEYEIRHDLCQAENREALEKLKRLSASFTALQEGLHSVQTKENSTREQLDNLKQLHGQLESVRSDRDRLQDDVDRFQGVLEGIENELERLREANEKLTSENASLTESMARYEASLADSLVRSEQEVSTLRDKMLVVQTAMQEKQALLEEQKEKLLLMCSEHQRETDALREQLHRLQSTGSGAQFETLTTTEHSEQDPSQVRVLEEQLQAQAQQLHDNHQAAARLQARVAELEKEGTLSSEQFDELQDKLSANEQELAEFRFRCAELQQAIEQQSNKFDVDRDEYERVVTYNNELLASRAELQSQMERKDEELRRVKDQLLSVASSNEEVERQLAEDVATQVERVNAEKGAISAQLEDLRRVYDEVAAQYDSCREQYALAVEANQQAAARIGDLEREKAELERVHSELTNDEVQELRKQLNANVEETQNISIERDRLQAALDQVSAQKDALEEALKARQAEFDGLLEQLNNKGNDLEKTGEDQEELRKVHEETLAELAAVKAQLAAVEQKNNEISGTYAELHRAFEALSAQYTACVNQYHAVVEANSQATAHINDLAAASTDFDRERQHLVEQIEKQAAEVQRLKEHLLTVEENSTREAIEAERRESALRERMAGLEEIARVAQSSAVTTGRELQTEADLLRARASSLEQETARERERADAAEKARIEASEALNALQRVVRELSAEHEQEMTDAQRKLVTYRQELQTVRGELETARRDKDEQTLNAQAAEDAAAAATRDAFKKQSLLEQLEVQLDGIRLASSAASTANTVQEGKRPIDDRTLRALVLSFLTAPQQRRADIALLVASVLQFEPDEMDRVRNALPSWNSQSGGGLGWLLGGAPRAGQMGPSLTQQFIRFLETETDAALLKSAHLPLVPNEGQKPTMAAGVLQAAADPPASSTPEPPKEAPGESGHQQQQQQQQQQTQTQEPVERESDVKQKNAQQLPDEEPTLDRLLM